MAWVIIIPSWVHPPNIYPNMEEFTYKIVPGRGVVGDQRDVEVGCWESIVSSHPGRHRGMFLART